MKTHTTHYTVVKGDTLSAIAARFGTTVERLVEWNHIADRDRIPIGLDLLVAEPSPSESYVPFPGAGFFTSTQDDRIIMSMGIRLVQEDCSAWLPPEGPTSLWTKTARESYAMWQRKLGYRGSDADGIPGLASWTKLKVPYFNNEGD
ncbi:peptidoglycan-binding protein [Embleya sp. NPDC050493]|uniref:peptidoglycan-binding protein n=1 Tax=Embleya sp. NPDC050493 TaxID=3363989 RepID=UPI0037B7FA4F